MTTTAFVDESRRRDTYFVIAAIVPNHKVAAHRKALRSMLKPGQRDFHAKRESASRNRQILRLIADLGLTARIYRCPDLREVPEASARYRALTQLGHDLAELKARRLVLEHREGQDRRDDATLLRVKQRTTFVFDFGHDSPSQEPMLWVADAVGWAYGRGGPWRELVTGLNLVSKVVTV